MSQHNEVGKIGEDLARKFLEEKDYKILEQNYRTRFAEIDLIAEKSEGFLEKPKLVFIEVRTKVGENFGSPEDTINKNKLRKVLWNAKSYTGFKNWQGACRIDAVCIVLNRDMSVSRLTHHENIIS
jgi:putative endonuclease